MIGLVVKIPVKDGHQAAFEAAMQEFVAAVKANEPGCIFYSLTKEQGSAATYVMMEQYKSQADIDHHNSTPHFQALLGKIGSLLDGAPVTWTLDVKA
jgi:quinol monooxygenase YgiN